MTKMIQTNPSKSKVGNLAEIASNEFEIRNGQPNSRSSMKLATITQVPEYLLVSSIDRNGQDIELLGLGQGNAFCGTRVPNHAVLPPEKFQYFLGAPAEYNKHFPVNKAVILTFDPSESQDVITTSIQNIAANPDLKEVPIVSLSVNYDDGLVSVIEHNYTRDTTLESKLVGCSTRPRPVDRNVLTLMCSDSRIIIPRTDFGVTMNIRTIAAHVPKYSFKEDETAQLNNFLSDWLLAKPIERQIAILFHGNHVHSGAVCGGAKASLNPESIHEGTLRTVVNTLAHDVPSREVETSNTPNSRAQSLAFGIKENLLSYPAVSKAIENGFNIDTQIMVAFLDTVTGEISEV
ncbi:MAG: hypothetical protein ACTSV2_06900 [Candidatus Thorarchaeota archaeon]